MLNSVNVANQIKRQRNQTVLSLINKAGFSHAMLGLRSIMVSSGKTANDINIHLFVLFAGQ